MNERIYELMKEAGYAAPELAGRAQRLTELIINECIDIANDTRYDGKVVANRIKFVFGVE